MDLQINLEQTHSHGQIIWVFGLRLERVAMEL